MSSGAIDQDGVPRHPYLAMLDELEEVRARYAGAQAWTMTPNEVVEALPRLARHKNAVAATELVMLREADRHQVGDPVGYANTAGWFAKVAGSTKPAAHRAVALAMQLDDDAHVSTREAALRGEVSVEQARVIIGAVEALPTDLTDPELRRLAEKDLVGFAEDHGPRELRFLGRRILEYRAPEVAEEAERRVLEAEERNAAATAFFEMHPDGHGSMLGRFKIPVLAGEILAKHLNAIAAPRHQAQKQRPDVEPVETRVARPLKLGSAFVEYLESRDAKGMPKAGGVPATIVVTMTLESLLGGDLAATLDSGERISAGEARRLACQAGIIPLVLGGKSEPLDVARKRRFHTESQRVAIIVRDKVCRAEGCDHPASMCHVHHLKQWSKGGRTTVEDAALICPRHHTLAHDARYDMKLLANNKLRFTRRT